MNIFDPEYWETKLLMYEEWERRRKRGLLGRLWDWLAKGFGVMR